MLYLIWFIPYIYSNSDSESPNKAAPSPNTCTAIWYEKCVDVNWRLIWAPPAHHNGPNSGRFVWVGEWKDEIYFHCLIDTFKYDDMTRRCFGARTQFFIAYPTSQSVSLNIYCSRCPLTRNNILAPRSSTFRSDADWRTDGVFHHIIIIINVQFVLVCVLLRQTFALEADSCVGVKNNFRYIFNHQETKRGRQLNNSSLNYGH